jgi:hypothetical protein
LILGQGGDFFLDAEVTKERFNLIFAQRAWVAKIMEEDEATHPIEVALLRVEGIMFKAHRKALCSNNFVDG